MRSKSSASDVASTGLVHWSVSGAFKHARRHVVASALYYSGLSRLLRRAEATRQLRLFAGMRWQLEPFHGSKFGILCYHRVGTEGVPLFSRLAPNVFEAQMRYVRKHYRIVSLGQLCAEIRDGVRVTPTLAITFDDGYRDLYTHAFPVLREYRIPATIYLIGRSMETGEAPWYDRLFAILAAMNDPVLELELDTVRSFILSSRNARLAATWEIVCYLRSIPATERRKWCAKFEARMSVPDACLQDRMLTWDQVRTMQNAGVFFGAHTMTHPSVSQLDPSEMEEEIGNSKSLLEGHLGSEISDFAYPFGKPSDCSPAAENMLARAGYRSAVTTTAGVNLAFANPLRLLRMQIGDDPSVPGFALGLSRTILEVANKPLDPPAFPSDGPVQQSNPQSRAY